MANYFSLKRIADLSSTLPAVCDDYETKFILNIGCEQIMTVTVLWQFTFTFILLSLESS
jgi:hypothetical protein